MTKLLNRLSKSHLSKWLLFLLISFLSWNYFGILFIINLYLLFEFISNIKTLSFYKYIFFAFVYSSLWHFGAIGWLLNVEQGFYGLVLSIFVYLIPFVTYYILSKFYFRLYLFIIIFILFELFINTSSFSNPLLTIGNSLGNQVYLSQWYSYTTVIGGSLWLMTIAYLVYQVIKKQRSKYLSFLLSTLMPIIFSLYLYYQKKPIQDESFKKVIVFNSEYYKGKHDNINIVLHLYKSLINSDAEFLILPETTFKFNSTSFKNTLTFKMLEKIIKETNIDYIFFGSQIMIKDNKSVNVGIFMDKSHTLIKVKKKLVPFTENIPQYLRGFYDKEIFVSNYSDDENAIIKDYNFLPLICYEGFYPLFNNLLNNKTGIIFLISSELFIKNSFFGKRQYLNFIRLRSIENRTPIIKSASFGYSCFIDNKGKIIEVADDNEFYSFASY